MKASLAPLAFIALIASACTVNVAPTGAASPSQLVTTPSSAPAASADGELSPSPTPQSAVTYSMSVSCNNLFSHSTDGAKALTKLGDHPDGAGLSRESFSGPRDDLKKDALHAPTALKPYINQMVDVLQSVVDIYDTGVNPPSIATQDFKDAGLSAIEVCGASS